MCTYRLNILFLTLVITNPVWASDSKPIARMIRAAFAARALPKQKQFRSPDQTVDVRNVLAVKRQTEQTIAQMLSGCFQAAPAKSGTSDDLFDDFFNDAPAVKNEPVVHQTQSGAYISIDALTANQAARMCALRLALAYERAYADVPAGSLIQQDAQVATCFHVGPLSDHDAAQLLKRESGIHKMITSMQIGDEHRMAVGVSATPMIPNPALKETLRSYHLISDRLADKRMRSYWKTQSFLYDAACMRHFHNALIQR